MYSFFTLKKTNAKSLFIKLGKITNGKCLTKIFYLSYVVQQRRSNLDFNFKK